MDRQKSVACRMTLTDVIALDPASTAGAVLRSNLAVLAHLGGSGMPPKTGISVFDVPGELKTPGTILLVGSPAGNGQGIRRTDADPKLDNVSFKEAAFYSLCFHTPPDSAVVMTYSPSACRRRLEFWTLPEEEHPRALLVLPAWFARYVPRIGHPDSVEPLATVPDTMVAIYVPPLWLQGPSLSWRAEPPGAENRLDVAATIINWLVAVETRRIVSFATYTAELEADIATAGLDDREKEELSRIVTEPPKKRCRT